MKTTDITEKVWVDANGELIGPFENQEEAQIYIDDRDDHGFNVENWNVVVFEKYTDIQLLEILANNGNIHSINNKL